jgi:hypothetical protein
MTPEGRVGQPWGPQLLYTVVPAVPAAPQYSLIYTQPLYQPQILQAVQAVQAPPVLATHQPPVTHYFRETKKNVKPIAPKPGVPRTDAIQESYCKKKKKAEWKSKTKRDKTKVTKMREEFILKPDKKEQVSKLPAAASESDNDDCEMPKLELQVPRPIQDHQEPGSRDPVNSPQGRKHRNREKHSEDDSDGDDIIKSLQKQVEEDDSDLDLFVPVKETDSEESGEAAFEKLLTSEMPKPKRAKPSAWEESPSKREKPSPGGLAVVTAPWGPAAATSFDLSEDYVKDYLKDKSKTDSTKPADPLKPPGLLMISPPAPQRASSRAVSMDVIPACLPDSVGSEISDILRGGFLTVSPPGPRALRRRPNRSGRSSPLKAGQGPGGGHREKVKNSRTKSTEDLPPNLLPEDYLDEVIGQYFNADSSSEEEQRVEPEPVESKPQEQITDSEEESSAEDGDPAGSKKVRSRPPASFFSMDFLDEPAHSDNTEVPDKVKTDLEIEKEYRHILYGKKRRPAKISVSKKRKAPSPYKEEKLRRRPTDETVEREERWKERAGSKQRTAVLREANGTARQQEPRGVQPVKKPVQTSRAKSPAKDITEPVRPEWIPVQHTWRGKKANGRAYDRSKMFQNTIRERPNVSAKIEDVTGRYSKEEELAKCGICEMMDPPAEGGGQLEREVEWVGCDCLRWFHKGCTRLAKFTEKFSCKSVRMKCLEADLEPEVPLPEVLQFAILKFCRDRDTCFIDNVMTSDDS